MKTMTLGWLVALGAAACSVVSCSEPPVSCAVGLAGAGYGYAVRYTVKSPAPACAAAAGVTKMGDIIGMESYHPANAAGTTYDATKTTLAFQSNNLALEAGQYASYTPPGSDTNATHTLYAQSAFVGQYPDASNMCKATTFTTAEQDFTAVAAVPAMPNAMPPVAGMPALPANTATYAWSNVSVYVTAADQGTQFAGDVTITEQGCAIDYHAVGLWPGVPCTNSTCDMNGNCVWTTPNPDACNPCAEPDIGRATGSGISPDALTECVQILPTVDPYVNANNDPDNSGQGVPTGQPPYWCVLKGTSDPPVLNPTPTACP